MQKVPTLNFRQLEMEAFDKLPKEIRDALNDAPFRVDPRFFYGMYKTQGLEDTLEYLEMIGFIGDRRFVDFI